jgi:hypothetical protein
VIEVKGLKLYETDMRDIDMKKDYGFPDSKAREMVVRIVLD